MATPTSVKKPSSPSRLVGMYVAWSSVVLAFAVRTAVYTSMFLTEKDVFYNGYLTCPRSAKVLNNYALHMLNPQHAGSVVGLLEKAIDLYPAYSNGHYNKGLAHYFLVRRWCAGFIRLQRDPVVDQDVDDGFSWMAG